MRLKRTNNNGELRLSDNGKEVVLSGWVHHRRDHGGLIFVDLRDRWGLTQVVFNPARNKEAHAAAEHIRNEWVISVRGMVEPRMEGMANPKLATGEIEIVIDELEVLSKSKPLPFPLDEYKDVGEEARLKYRYLDLRRDEIQQNLVFRSKVAEVTRNFFWNREFVEIETPFLVRSTPEGARDFLVPARRFFGKFYALPQSPQIYKQLLMVSGFDRYFQITRCFRDEDLRKDRQPEFTQIDFEMSFVDEEDIFHVIEGLVVDIFAKAMNTEIEPKFRRLTHEDAMNRYGVDKPDTRFGLEMVDVSDLFEKSDFKVFRSVVENGGIVKSINVNGGASMSRSQIDALIPFAQEQGAGGMAWIKATANGLESSIAKFLDDACRAALTERMEAKPGDLLIFVADRKAIVNRALGALRLKLGEDLNLIDHSKFDILFVTEFPLFEMDEENKRLTFTHHMFTAPVEEDLKFLESDPLRIRSRAYDLVINGTEIVSGSIRIHDHDMQMRMFNRLGISEEDARGKFGFLMTAFDYGPPPHGGAAFGFDRFVMLLRGATSIREVIAFPKTNQGVSLMDEAPSEVDAEQLIALGIKIRKN